MDLELARHLAEEASSIALVHLRRGVEARAKGDGSPVTPADLEIERRLREILAAQRPADAVLGEEYGLTGSSSRRWIIDPIDGTSNFVAGRPFWGTHVALEEDGEITVGVITRPAHGATWWARRGGGAYRSDGADSSNVRRLRVSTTHDLGNSRMTVWTHVDHPIVACVKRSCSWIEPDLDAILRLVEGEIDGVVASDGKPWDHAPAVVIVEEAGGAFSDKLGGRRIDLEEALFTNGHIHEPVLELSRAAQLQGHRPE